MKKKASIEQIREQKELQILSNFSRMNNKIQEQTRQWRDETPDYRGKSDQEFNNKMLQQDDMLAKANEMLATNPIKLNVHGREGVLDSVSIMHIPHNEDSSWPSVTFGDDENSNSYSIGVQPQGIDKYSRFGNLSGTIDQAGFHSILGVMQMAIKNSGNFNDQEKSQMMQHVIQYMKPKVA